MRFAILSDIHGNIYALKEALKDIEQKNIDAIIFCGDYVTDIPRSNEVIETIKIIMKKYTTYIIRGNREEKVLSYENNDKETTINNENVLFTYEDLKKENFNFLSSLPETCVIDIENLPKIYVSHARDYNCGNDCKYKIFGHSHKQYIFSRDGIKYINPGSIGLPTDGDNRLKYCILTLEKNIEKIELISIKYDYLKAINDIENNRISQHGIKWGMAVKKLLKTGIDYPVLYLEEVVKIAKEHGLDANKETMPLEVWKEARKSLEIKWIYGIIN